VRNRSPLIYRPDEGCDCDDLSFLKDLFISAIYTDGSWSRSNTLSSLLLGNGTVSTAGGIVVHTNRGMILIRVEMDIDCGGAFESEVLSLLIAHEVASDRELTVWTDC
jgi:hypothetical protein